MDKKKEGGAKAEKQPKEKRKKGKKPKASLYESREEGIKRMRRACPKCGAGVFMARHTDRASCGRCGYTEWNAGGH